MDWKVTARTGTAHMKVFREERERSVILCVDKGAHMNFGTRKTYKSIQAARAAALLGWAANSLQDRVGGLLFGGDGRNNRYFRPTKDRRALWQLLKAMTTDHIEHGPSTPELLADILRQAARGIGTGGLVFVIADFNRDHQGLLQGLAQLRQRHAVVLIPVDDPADREMPDMGDITFRGPDGELLTVNTADPTGQDAYRKAWQQRRNDLVQLAHGSGCAMIPVDTDSDVHATLMQGLERRLRMRSFL
jgi:uncharacterized protein (DUF58 family)